MWTCVRCQRSIEPSLDTCWACGTTRDGVVDPTFELAEAAPSDGGPGLEDLPAVVPAATDAPAADDVGAAPSVEAARPRSAGGTPLRCLRCHDDLRYRGRRALPFSLASSGDEGASDDLDVYACPTCGRVEMFLRP